MRSKLAVICFSLLAALHCMAAETAPDSPPLKCDIGPVNRSYGMAEWLVYSCNDSRSLVFVSAPGSPAMPFVFSFIAEKQGYRLSGEGTGNKEATAAAFNELKALSEQEITSLVELTKTRKKQ